MVHQDGAAATSGTMWCWLVVPHVDGDGVVLHLHHSKHQPTSIVTPDNYSFCPCTRGRLKNAAMYVHKSFAFIKTAVVGAIFCGVYMAAHIYKAGCQFSQEKAVSQSWCAAKHGESMF